MNQARKEYWETRLSSNSGLRGAGHISRSRSWNDWAYRVKARALRRVARKTDLDLRAANVLDVGSGTGFAIDFWQRQGVKRLTGLDLTDYAVKQLGERYPQVPFWQRDIGDVNMEVPGTPFDLISSMEVLFHIVDDERYLQALHNIHNLLRPGGWFVFSDNFLRHGELRSPHQVSRNLATILAAVRGAGLDPVARVPMYIFMDSPVDSTSARRQQAWRGTIGRAAKSERWGAAVGCGLAAVDLVATRLRREGPSVEIMLCRRPNTNR